MSEFIVSCTRFQITIDEIFIFITQIANADVSICQTTLVMCSYLRNDS